MLCLTPGGTQRKNPADQPQPLKEKQEHPDANLRSRLVIGRRKNKKRVVIYQVFNRPLVLVDLPQSLIISLHFIDELSQVLGNTHTHTRTHHWSLVDLDKHSVCLFYKQSRSLSWHRERSSSCSCRWCPECVLPAPVTRQHNRNQHAVHWKLLVRVGVRVFRGDFCEKTVKAPTPQGAQEQAGTPCNQVFSLRVDLAHLPEQICLWREFSHLKGSKTSITSDAEPHFQFWL